MWATRLLIVEMYCKTLEIQNLPIVKMLKQIVQGKSTPLMNCFQAGLGYKNGRAQPGT